MLETMKKENISIRQLYEQYLHTDKTTHEMAKQYVQEKKQYH